MTRGLPAVVGSLLLVGLNNTAQAQSIDISLNLQYTVPSDTTQGGMWALVAKTNSANGIASIHAVMSNVNGFGITYQPGIGAMTTGGNPFVNTTASAVELLYAQEISDPVSIVTDVGRGAGTPGNVPVDPLNDPIWNNAAAIARGTFGAMRPAFTSNSDTPPNVTDGNVLATKTPPFSSLAAATVTTIVRDNLANLLGDYNHNGSVDAADYVLWRKTNGQMGSGLAADGDGNMVVNQADYNIWRSRFGMTSGSGAAIGTASGLTTLVAVPEPGSFTIFLTSLAIPALLIRRRRTRFHVSLLARTRARTLTMDARGVGRNFKVFGWALLAGVAVVGAARGQVINSEWNTGSGIWNEPANWLPSAVPDNGGGRTFNVQIGNRAVAANALIRYAPQDGASDTVSTLAVSGGADLLTSSNQLNVLGQTTIDGAGTTLRIDSHDVAGTPAFTTLHLDVNNGGGLSMAGGILTVITLLENNNSVVSGFGTINLGDLDVTAEQAFENSGLIQVLGTTVNPGMLTLHTNGVDTIDLDGDNEMGVVDVANAVADPELDTLTFIVDGPLVDPFGGVGGTLQIGQRDTITFNENFQIATGAAIQMDGGNNVATLNGPGAITSIAGAAFTIASDAVIANDMTFTGTANTITVGANASLTLNGTVAIPQASALVLSSGSELVIGGATTITDAANDFDWDGGPANTTVQGAGILTLNVDQIDAGSDTYNSTLKLNDDGDLTVNVTGTSWTMAGTLNKNNTGTSTVAGDAVNVTGTVTVNVGTLSLPATTLASGSTVTVNGGELRGGVITVGGANGIQGAGLVSARVINNSRLRAETGTLVFQTAVNDNDWDGAGNTGLLNAVSGGTLELRDNTVFGFTGTVTATGNSRVFTNGFGLDFNPGSTINLTASKYQSTMTTEIGGAVNIAPGGDSTIQVEVNRLLRFESTSVTTLNANLRLANNNIVVDAGATFSGAGALNVPDGSHLVALANANINVLVDMDGTFRPGGSEAIGRIDMKDYQQSDTGELFVELTGTGLNQFDRLVINGAALIDGYLNIDIDPVSPGVPFVPVLGQTFNIITATAGVSGTFDFRDVSGMPAGLTFHVNYLPTAVQLLVVSTPFFSADFDNDGDVDGTDLSVWRGAYDLNQLGDADGDNDTDGADFLLWQRQFGSQPGAGAGAASGVIPEPETLVLLLLALLTTTRQIAGGRTPRAIA